MNEQGRISVNTENIMPIIKKWLYSDEDIFIRELVSNGTDAISKHQKLVAMGETEAEEQYFIKVICDKEQGILTFRDNGIGMTAEEVRKYINQVAFSGAADFLAKYEAQPDALEGIIGHFGLGFYSAFMVAGKVTIDTLSCQSDAEAVRWESDGGSEYTITSAEKAERGTDITLYLTEESKKYAEADTVRQTLNKYCAFMPVPIFLEETGKTEEKLEPVNDVHPLWQKAPSECTEEEYKKFYHKVFLDFNEPLFWIHLNVDHPFRLKGILYFPKLTENIDTLQGQIKLYNNQVFVADNIKEIIPEFLLLLKGAIDCPDLPLNVSRSFLQNDATVKRISNHITKKVADRLCAMAENEKEQYQSYWDDINVFIKYGCLREEKFYDRMQEHLLYKTAAGEYLTLQEYLERNKEKHENKVYYTSDVRQQAQYINLLKENGLEAVVLGGILDIPFMQHIEMKNPGVTFARVDSDLPTSLKDTTVVDVTALGEELKKLLGDEKLTVKGEALKSEMPAVVLLDEYSRRMQDSQRFYGGMNMADMFPKQYTLVLNTTSPLIATLQLMPEGEEKELYLRQVYDLAMLAHAPLESEGMHVFLSRSVALLNKLAGK